MELDNIVKYLIENEITISTMESCTGGLLASLITDVKNASSILKYSAVTYSNEFKIKMGVSEEVIEKYTVYSKETAKEHRLGKYCSGSDYDRRKIEDLDELMQEQFDDKKSVFAWVSNSMDGELTFAFITLKGQNDVIDGREPDDKNTVYW